MNNADYRISYHNFMTRQLPCLCLCTAVVLECLMMFIGKMNGRMLYPPFRTGLALCCILFTAVMILNTVKGHIRPNLILSGIMTLWFCAVQLQHHRADMVLQPWGMFLSSYLIAYPFAAAAQDAKKQTGLKLTALFYIFGALVLVGYTGLLVLDHVPPLLEKRLYWNNFRLTALHHPNITARAFMVSIALCLGLSARISQKWAKIFLWGIAVLTFFALSFTNCRTAIILTCLFCGGFVFLTLFRTGFRQFLFAAAAAVALSLCLFFLSQELFQWNTVRLTQVQLLQQSQGALAADSAGSTVIPVPEAAVSSADAPNVTVPEEIQPLQIPEPAGLSAPATGSIVSEDGILYYYENGEKCYAGLIWMDGSYYYVNGKCMVVTGRYEISKTNGLMEAGVYTFAEDGRMIPAKNGFYEEDGALYYYENNEKCYAGLIQRDGDYYYVNGKCTVVTGEYEISKTNGLMEPGIYFFRKNGKMVTDPREQAALIANLHNTAVQNSIGQDLSSLNGRTGIWKTAFAKLRQNPSLLVTGCDSTAVLLAEHAVSHSHNSWLEILLRLGLPAFLICLIFACQAIGASLRLLLGDTDLWKKSIAMLVLCLLASGFLEPHLFLPEEVWHYTDFLFFLCLGYLLLWQKEIGNSRIRR